MKKMITTMLAVALIALASPAFAQTDELFTNERPAGLTPASPFFFVERFFEGVGTFFTFGNSAKAERYLALAAERLAEAKALAEEGDERAMAAVALYEEQYADAKERAEETEDLDLESRVTDATTRHLSVLDEVYEKVPEQAKASIQAARERSMTGQIEALRGIAGRDPEAAIDIFARAAEGRLMAAQARANRGGDDEAEDVEEALDEFEQYAAFGNEISTLAGGLQTGETAVEQLVERATSHYRDVLQDVQSKVPPQAQQSIQRAMESAGQLEGRRPVVPTPAPAQRSAVPTDAAGATQEGQSGAQPGSAAPTGQLPPQAGQGSDDEEAEIENENETGTGGPPQGIPVPVTPGRP